MRTIEAAEAAEPLSTYARNAGGETLIVTEDGVPIAAVIPLDAEDADSLALGANARFLQIIEEARAQRRQGGGVSADEVRRQLGL